MSVKCVLKARFTRYLDQTALLDRTLLYVQSLVEGIKATTKLFTHQEMGRGAALARKGRGGEGISLLRTTTI